MAADLIDGKAIASEVRYEVSKGVKELFRASSVTPNLAVVLVGEDPASKVYVKSKRSAAVDVGMKAHDFSMPYDTSSDVLIRLINDLNNDNTIHGILVQLPLPPVIDQDMVICAINPDKDVDGLHPFNVGRLVQGKQRFVPATPAGIQQLLLRTGRDPAGKHVVVCGRSDIVGKPISILLAQRRDGSNSTVTVCHTQTRELSSITRQADILIAAMGHPEIISAEMVKEGAVVIDVGVNRVNSPSSRRGFRLVGDVHFESVVNKASAITPVPGGVGPMTIAMVLYNTLKAARLSLA